MRKIVEIPASPLSHTSGTCRVSPWMATFDVDVLFPELPSDSWEHVLSSSWMSWFWFFFIHFIFTIAVLPSISVMFLSSDVWRSNIPALRHLVVFLRKRRRHFQKFSQFYEMIPEMKCTFFESNVMYVVSKYMQGNAGHLWCIFKFIIRKTKQIIIRRSNACLLGWR
jgi:hypothetical protein